jgi:phage/plasmid primase-like uncharacterized protein
MSGDRDGFWADARSADTLAVARSLGAKLKKVGAAEWAGACPACGGKDRFSVNTRKGVFNCRGAGGGDVIQMVEHLRGCSPIEAAERITNTSRPDRTREETSEERHARQAMDAQRLSDFQQSEQERQRIEEAKVKRDDEAIAYVREYGVPVLDSAKGKAYFDARGLNPNKRLTKDILFVPELLYYYGARANGDDAIVRLATLPAVVALIRNAQGAVMGYSATYLDPKEPRKFEGAPGNSPTKIRGHKQGGMIRLGRVGETMAFSEGYLNALAWSQLGHGPKDVALGAAIDLGNLAEVNLPEGVRTIIIIADNDSEPAALHAHLLTAVKRFQGQGLEVSIHWPPSGSDWNNALLYEARGVLLPEDVKATEETRKLRHPGGVEDAEEFLERAKLLLEPKPKPIIESPQPLMRELPPADPFPIEALGGVLAPAARAIHDRVRAPLAICGQSVLAAATLAVQGHADVELPTGQKRPLAEFYLTVAATGERKTSADIEALGPVRKREAALHEEYGANRHDYENSQLAWEKARDAAIRAVRPKGDRDAIKYLLDQLGPAPDAPLIAMLTCPEPTYEGLCKAFQLGYPSLGIFAGEGGQFIGGHGMSDEAKLRTIAGLSAVLDGEPIKRVRADGATVLPGRRLTTHLMAQPDVASEMLNDPLLISQGLLSRVLTTAPDAASGTRLWRPPSPEAAIAMEQYDAKMLKILEAPLPLADGAQNTLAPRTLRLAPAAGRLWIAFYDHIEKELASGGSLEPIRGLANKLPEHAARIAGVLALVGDIDTTEVAPVAMERGIELAQHYAVEGLRLYGASRVRAELGLSQALLDWLLSRAEPVVSLPCIYQLGPGAIRDKAREAKIAGILEDHGYLARVDGGAEIKGKWRRVVWWVIRE